MTEDSSIVEPADAGTIADETRSTASVIRRSLLRSVSLAAGWVLIDQLSKHWAVNALDDRNIDLVGSLRFNLHFNSGMAFGRGTGFGPVIGVVAIVVVAALLVSLRRSDSTMSSIGVGLVIGGAVGNVVDRLFRGSAWFRGAVVDFIDLQWFPIFNVADIGVNIGAGLLILSSLLSGRRAKAAQHSTVR